MNYTLINAACEDVLPGEYWKSVDLILTSPPYDGMRTYAGEGDVVLDPMAGSGTTISAAIELKRKAVGIEISKEYCEGTHKRLELEHGGMFDFSGAKSV